MITTKATISYKNQIVPPLVTAVQGDTGRNILFTISDYEIPAGATATFYIQKPSKEAVYNTAVIDASNNTVEIELTAQCLAEYGENFGQIRIMLDGEVITSFDFILLVKTFRGIDAIESTSETNIFDQAVEAAAGQFQTEAEAIVDEVIESIPEDYSALSQDVTDLKADFNQITELTRNLNTAQMGRYGNAADGKIYSRSNNYYGMASFIPVIAAEKYTISYNDILSTNDLSITILYLNNNDEVVSRSGYTATNPRVITVPENAVKMNLHFYSTSEVSVSSSSYVQIERGEVKTQYIKPVSAIDDVLREEIKQTPIKYMSAIGAMLDIALGYLNVSYNNDLVDLTHESGKGLFFTDIKNDNDKFVIQCSEFATALYKGVAWDQSRYCVSQNSIAKWGYTTDGTEQTEQDGVPYALSYYDYINNPSLHQTSDIVSKDYMIASEMFRYALNHGWGYEITDIRKQVRPGDFVFYVDSHDIPEKVGKYKGITHVALAIDVGYDNNKLTILESNNYYLPSKDDDVGIGIGVVNITDYKYGARFPVNESESEYTILADTSLNITGEVTDWSSVPIYSDITQEAGNIYTVELNCELENLNYLKIGVRYNDGIKWNVPMINGNVASIVFYANEDFQYVYAGIYNNQTYTLKKMSLYKGYASR